MTAVRIGLNSAVSAVVSGSPLLRRDQPSLEIDNSSTYGQFQLG